MVERYIVRFGDTVDSIAWKHYGRHNGTTETIREANRGLSEYPLALPEGLIIVLPDLPDEQARQTVKLYD